MFLSCSLPSDLFSFTFLGLVANMANVKTYTWITLWFLLTAPVILWNTAYCFMRYVCSVCVTQSY